MQKIPLKNKTIESHYGRGTRIVPSLLEKCNNKEGVFLSEQKVRLYSIRNYKNAPNFINSEYYTSTLFATKGETAKIILPYETGSKTLTDISRIAWSWVNPNEKFVNDGVNLDINSRWEKLEGDGVYTRQRDEWFEKHIFESEDDKKEQLQGCVFYSEKGKLFKDGTQGIFVGLNKNMTEEQAMRCPLLLTKLGHPDYVDGKFRRSKDEVAEIIGGTYKLGKQKYGYGTVRGEYMMGQWLPDVSNKGVLKAWFVRNLYEYVLSGAWAPLDCDTNRFAFESVGARDQLKSLEGMLKPNQVNQINNALDERDELREKLLTTDQIYSVIGDYIGSANEMEVRKVLDGLTSQ